MVESISGGVLTAQINLFYFITLFVFSYVTNVGVQTVIVVCLVFIGAVLMCFVKIDLKRMRVEESKGKIGVDEEHVNGDGDGDVEAGRGSKGGEVGVRIEDGEEVVNKTVEERSGKELGRMKVGGEEERVEDENEMEEEIEVNWITNVNGSGVEGGEVVADNNEIEGEIEDGIEESGEEGRV